jgi:translation initiation factor 1 (eIF-1/SUI1)
MDPFEQNNNNNQLLSTSAEVWIEQSGKKKNTYITGLNFTNKELQEHLKNLKKMHGCNGCIKDIIDDKNTISALQLQGDHINHISDYFKQHNINDIKIRGT